MSGEGAELAAGVRKGDVIAGKYRVDRVLGVGGMGVVVAATHLNLHQRVALKFLLPQANSHPDVMERFAREARAAAKIQSEHVARVIDVDVLPTGAPYMVMEYLDGEDLKAALVRLGPMPLDLAVGYVLQACEALAEAHALGVVHRDLKPANLFLAKRANGDPIVKVLDFGISKSIVGGEAELTKSSTALGSPRYMSPEQMTSSRTVDPRADLWSVGVVLYELLSGTTPFPAETMPELVGAILMHQPQPLRAARPELPEGVVRLVERCLQKNPADRFPDVAALAQSLAPFGPSGSDLSVKRISRVLTGAPGPVAAPVVRVTDPTMHSVAQVAETNAPWAQPETEAPGRGWTLAMVALGTGIALFLTAGVGLYVARASHPPAAATAPEAEPAPPATVSAAAAPQAPPSASSPPEPARTPAPQATTASSLRREDAPRERSKSSPSSPPKPPAAATPNCTPPFIIDAQGHHQYKPECI